jgi:hypothetical protein
LGSVFCLSYSSGIDQNLEAKARRFDFSLSANKMMGHGYGSILFPHASDLVPS